MDKLKSLTKVQIQQAIKVITGVDDPYVEQYMSYEDRLAIKNLAQERAAGRYKDDASGFAKEI